MSSIVFCSVEDCKNKAHSRTWCKTHYSRWYFHKDLTGRPKTARSNHRAEYDAWHNIIQRVTNPQNPNYHKYGGRGINMCAGWKESVDKFIEDMGIKPSSTYSVDRINNNLGYYCGRCSECFSNGWNSNCRWADKRVQAQNRTLLKANKNGFIGVIKRQYSYGVRYAGRITDNDGKVVHLGQFTTPEEAGLAYDKAAIFFRGNEAVTNML